jgi:Flp pilus assembly protein TadG
MTVRAGRGDDGNLLVELTVIAPVLFALALLIVALGRVSEARQEVVEAARAGAQSAAVLPNSVDAAQGAAESAVVGIFNRSQTCERPEVTTDVSHFVPSGYVTVTVACSVSLSDLGVPAIPGSTVIRASAIAPIDPYRSVT